MSFFVWVSLRPRFILKLQRYASSDVGKPGGAYFPRRLIQPEVMSPRQSVVAKPLGHSKSFMSLSDNLLSNIQLPFKIMAIIIIKPWSITWCCELWREGNSLQTPNILIYFHICTILCFLSVQGPHSKTTKNPSSQCPDLCACGLIALLHLCIHSQSSHAVFISKGIQLVFWKVDSHWGWGGRYDGEQDGRPESNETCSWGACSFSRAGAVAAKFCFSPCWVRVVLWVFNTT